MAGMLALAICAAVLGICAPARAQDPLGMVRDAVEDISGADLVRYDAKDDGGASLDGLDVLALPGGGYAGVHHSLVGGRFEARVATSDDLLHWRHRAVLDSDSAMPSIAAVAGGGFVVAYEHGSTLRVLPRVELPPEIAGPTGLWTLNKNQLRFRFYPSLEALLAGTSSRRYTAPRRLSRTDEGTPDVAVRRGRTPKDLVLDVTFHHFKDLDGDGLPDADRQAVGVLRGFRRWSAAEAPQIDALFLGATAFHDGFGAAPSGSIGDRDLIAIGGRRLVLHEAQYAVHDFATWRLWLRDEAGGPAIPVAPRTHGASRSFGNPSVVALPAPSGRPALLVTAFAFSEGAAPGEAGALIALHLL